MKIEELIKELERLPSKLEVLVHFPVQGDCENCRPMTREFFTIDDRFPALIFFDSPVTSTNNTFCP